MTPNSNSSQAIPTQLSLHGRSPTHEDKRDLFLLSRLDFHLRRASAAITEEVEEEAKVAKCSKETDTTTKLHNNNRLSNKDAMNLCSCLCLGISRVCTHGLMKNLATRVMNL